MLGEIPKPNITKLEDKKKGKERKEMRKKKQKQIGKTREKGRGTIKNVNNKQNSRADTC